MENLQENEQNQKEGGSNLTGTDTHDPQPLSGETKPENSKDQDELRKAEDELPDANKFVDSTDELLGDVHPIDRDQTSQEEHNANQQSK